MPRDVVSPTPAKASPRGSLLERLFDEHSDGRFVKTLLISMLLIATVVQPFSLIYTAYGDHLPHQWWTWTPALAVLLFLALDWTILPLAYFFATTSKPGLKVMLGLMLAVVAFGAFEGYFTATERLVAMRLEEITKHRLAVERAEAQVERLDGERNKKISQQREDRDQLDKQRQVLTSQLEQIDKQISETQSAQSADKAQHPRTMAEIKDGCMRVPYVCLGPKQDAELKRHTAAQGDLPASSRSCARTRRRSTISSPVSTPRTTSRSARPTRRSRRQRPSSQRSAGTSKRPCSAIRSTAGVLRCSASRRAT